MSIWQVALPRGGADWYDYLPPQEGQSAEPGRLVEVPFGRGRLWGLVVGQSQESSVPTNRLRRVHSLGELLLDPQPLRLLRFAAQHYVHPLGLTIDTALPPGVSSPAPAAEVHWTLSTAGRSAVEEGRVRGQRQQLCLQQLLAAEAPLPRSSLDISADGLRRLQGHGWIEAASSETVVPAATAEPITLRPDQRAAAEAIALDQGFAAYLLDAPTGSGKTEVYLDKAHSVIRAGGQVLMLVPEIALTPQTISRVQARLGARVGVLHSQMARGERLRTWHAARSGEVDLLLATRSGVFTPLPRLGLILVDEEHDASYKQQEGLRYSARDLAVYRASLAACPVVLGSATPALESLANAQAGRYQRLSLDSPAAAQSLQLVDLRSLPAREPLSPALRGQMQTHLDRGGQVFLFLNRRGYAPVLFCTDCQWTPQCQRCDSAMVWHRDDGRLRCHHCGAQQPPPKECPSCACPELAPVGWGTQRVMEALEQHFPQIPALRFDRDSLRRRGALEEALQALRENQARIVVGTQMLAKGHDFPHLSLVAVIDADSGLYSADFRAGEALGQLLTQVRGRAGRRAQEALCLIQTRNAEHPQLQAWLQQGYSGLAQMLLAERAEAGWPPFARLALLRSEAPQEEANEAFFRALRPHLPGFTEGGVECLGPVKRPRRRGLARSQLLLRAPSRGPLAALLPSLRQTLESAAWARKVRWSVDVDPWTLD
ncbi:MAG: primosomal protein N' [Oceanococcaceae bacterium]